MGFNSAFKGLMKTEFSRQIFEKKNTQTLNFTKIHPVGAELFHANGQMDRQTDRHDEVNSCFSRFGERA